MLKRLVFLSALLLITHCGKKADLDMAGIGFPSDDNTSADIGASVIGDSVGTEVVTPPSNVSFTTFEVPMVGVRGIVGQQPTDRENIPSS